MKREIKIFDNSSVHRKDRRDCGRSINENTKISLCLPCFFCNLRVLSGELLRFLVISTVLLLAVFSAKILPAEQVYAGKSPTKPQNLQSVIGEGGNRRVKQGAPNKSV
ncbi:MAG TPA: hypothetical protein ACFYD4_13905, partial [Candidatus Wunengus sp. YC61]